MFQKKHVDKNFLIVDMLTKNNKEYHASVVELIGHSHRM